MFSFSEGMEAELDLVLIEPRPPKEAGVSGSETLLCVGAGGLLAKRLGSQTWSLYVMSWKGMTGDWPREDRGLGSMEGSIDE